ncbi:MAG: (5-formylfuran-3-yl)methyl phosphate synthase [Planctomycetaceae bacterium]
MISQPAGRYRFPGERRSMGSRLLVSVRSVEEAVRAVTGGADILDVKEPDQGSLGMASLESIQAIADQFQQDHTQIPLSVALGELRDWLTCEQFPQLPSAVQFAKLGLSGMATESNWQAAWHRVRAMFSRSQSSLRWVAVAYADHVAADSPTPDEILNSATTADEAGVAGCAGLLIDTFTKTGASLLDYYSVADLQDIAERCHASGLFLAVAGSLTTTAIRDVKSADADIVAVRSAACRNGNRRAEIDELQVAAICKILREK